MNITESQFTAQLDGFGEHRIEIVTDLAHDGEPDAIGPALLLAMGSREAFLRNIVGDAGHGRGWLRIDDRFHRDFLSSHRGCVFGSWTATKPSALPRGLVPSLTAATRYAIELLTTTCASLATRACPRARCCASRSPPARELSSSLASSAISRDRVGARTRLNGTPRRARRRAINLQSRSNAARIASLNACS